MQLFETGPEISPLEEMLGIPLPPSYTHFLRLWNGCDLSTGPSWRIVCHFVPWCSQPISIVSILVPLHSMNIPYVSTIMRRGNSGVCYECDSLPWQHRLRQLLKERGADFRDDEWRRAWQNWKS